MFYADENYEAVREATIEDVGGILALIKPLEDAGVLVPRSREQLELEISFFDVMVRDGTVIACSALFPFPQNQMANSPASPCTPTTAAPAAPTPCCCAPRKAPASWA